MRPAAAHVADDPRRRLLLELFQAGLARVDGRRCTREALEPTEHRVRIAAVGKAASAMMLGAFEALGGAIEHALLITKDGHVDTEARALPNVEILESAHPVPDLRSLAAGERLLRWVDELPADVRPLFLISGGASSLVEVLEPGIGFADLMALNRRGLAQGLSIGELNAERSKLSRIKGGRLAGRFADRPAQALFISDVPGDDPAVIGSGLMGPGAAPDQIERTIVGSIDHAVAASRAVAEARGLTVWTGSHRFADDAERLAVRFVHELHMNREQVRIWGGESVVRLPERPGRGGRNQQLALAAARVMAGQDDLLLLAAGTDGTDGPTEDAGALVDGETCSRIAIAEQDVEASLKAADAGTALAASGDLVHTGPTGTNVGDLVIGLKLVM
jgi:glycerate 2-kinase